MEFFLKMNAEAENRVNEAIDLAVKMVVQYFDRELMSILLAGSFARGEGAWKSRGDKIDILSDLDLLVVLKTHKETPSSFTKDIQSAIGKMGITIDLKIKPSLKLRFYPKDTHTYDYVHASRVIYGKDPRYILPYVSQQEIGNYGMENIFFNRVILNIEKIKLCDMISSSKEDLLRLSYSAAKTMFTCSDIIAISHRGYSPYISERVKLSKERIRNFTIDHAQFVKDLTSAFEFVFQKPEQYCIEDVHDYWVRAQQYFIQLFLSSMKRRPDMDEIFCYPFRMNLRYSEKVRSFFQGIYASFILFRKNHHFCVFWRPHPACQCRMACLMLYLALGQKNNGMYIQKAQEYCSGVCPDKNQALDSSGQWLVLRDHLFHLHKLGIF